MKMLQLLDSCVTVTVFALSIVVTSRSQLVHTCLDHVTSGQQCCTPSAFIKLAFTISLSSDDGNCDSPSYLDQGVRLEVRKPGSTWEPIRFYTATGEATSDSLVTPLPGGTHVLDENNSTFPMYEIQGSELFTASEYICGDEYYVAGTEYRWLQRYSGPSSPGMETWSLGNVSFEYSEHGTKCSARLTKDAFRNADGEVLEISHWTPPACEHVSSQPLTLYFNDISEVEGYIQRGVLITPTWWNADCSWRMIPGCVLSDGCTASIIGDQMCSVGSGMQCQCEHPHITGDGNTCFDGIVGFERTAYDISEEESAVLCVVILQGRLIRNVTLTVHTCTNGTAREGSDFSRLSHTVILTPTHPKQCVTITIEDDRLQEETESFTVYLLLTGELNDIIQLSQDTASVSIVDNDFVIMGVPNSVREGETADITLTLLQNSNLGERVRWQTFPGSANISEFCHRNGIFSLELLITEANLRQICVKTDDVWEGYEYFSVILTVNSNVYTRTIYVTDINEVKVGFNASDYTANETDNSVIVCVALQEGSIADNTALQLTVSTQDIPQSAQEVLDYRGISDVAALSSTVSEQCFALFIVDDTAVEHDEIVMVFLSLSRGVNNVILSQPNVTVQIVDDDVVMVGFEKSTYTANEQDISAVVCVELVQGTLGIPVNLSIHTHSLNVQDNADYTRRPITLTLTPSNLESCVSIMFQDDLVLEETEPLRISLTGQLNSAVQFSQDTAIIYVIDDDVVVIGFKQLAYTTCEANMSVTVCLEVNQGTLGIPVDLSLSTSSGSAQEGIDYTEISSSIVTLTSTDMDRCIILPVVDDPVFEKTEYLTISLFLTGQPNNSLQLSPATTTILITDDDVVDIGFVKATYSASEHDMSMMVCVEVKLGTLGIPVNFTLSTVSITAQVNADYTASESQLTLFPFATPHCVNAIVIVNDSVVEVTESLALSLSLTEDMNGIHVSQPTTTLFIIDDDDIEIRLDRTSYTVKEDVGSLEVCVMLDDNGLLGTDLELYLETSEVTAQDGMDYREISAGTLTLTSNDFERCIAVTIVDDSVLEDTEYLTVSLSYTGLLSVRISPAISIIYINDDDVVGIGFMQSEYTASEHDISVMVCVQVMQGTLGIPVHLSLSTLSMSAEANDDYSAAESILTLFPLTKPYCTTAITIVNDLAVEVTESLAVSLSLIEDLNRIQLLKPMATIIITDDDGVKIGLEQCSYTVEEDIGSLNICVILVGNGILGTNVELQLSTHEETAHESEDFQMLSENITLSPNVSKQCALIKIIDDVALELNETLRLSLSFNEQLNNVELSQCSAMVIINDDDALDVGFQKNYTTLEAEEDLQVCVVVFAGHLATNITLLLTTHSGTAKDGLDYTKLSTNTITLTPNLTESCVSLTIVDDSVLENTECLSVSLSLTGELNDGVRISEDTASLCITDDDEVHVEFTNSGYTTNETTTAVEVCVSVRGVLGANITLQLDTHEGTAQGGVDYEDVSENVTLTPTETKGCISVNIMDDKIVELSENLSISLSPTGLLNRGQLLHKSVAVVILDNDVALLELKQMISMDMNEIIRVVDVCVVTNSTLERNIVLSIVTIISIESDENASLSSENGNHTLVLQPGDSEVCIRLNVSPNEMLLFYVTSNNVDVIQIKNPNGTIIVEPSFNDVRKLLSGDNVDIVDVVEELEKLVNSLIESGQTASAEFTNTFLEVVSDLLHISNTQSSQENQTRENENEKNPGTTLLNTLDKFALRAFNISLGPIARNNTKLLVQEVYGKQADDEVHEIQVTQDRGSGVTAEGIGIKGGENDEIILPQQIFQHFNFTVTVASYYLRNVTGILPVTLPNISGAELVSSVLSSALDCGENLCDPVVNRSQPVRIKLQHRKFQEIYEEARCVFYDLNNNYWSEKGCDVIKAESTDEETICHCYHLTHFAVMLSPKNTVSKEDAFRLQVIGYVGISISLLCLLITIFIFCYFKSLWSMRHYIHVNLCINLFLAQLLFVAGIDKTTHPSVCQTIAVVLHYSFLVTFMWMLMEGVVLYVALVKVFVTKPRRYIIGFTIISYGVPLLYMALVVPLGFLLSDEPHYGGDLCWLKSNTNFIWAFVTPVIIVILINIGFFAMAIYIIWKQQRRKNLSTSQIQKAKHWLKVSLSLLVVMGITWIIGVLTFHESLLFVSYIFTIVVAFQGALIFILFVVLSKQVRITLRKWLVRNIITKSDFLSEHFSEFTRSTQAGYSQSHSHASSHVEKSTITHGIQLGTFLALPEKSTIITEMEKELAVTVSPSPPPTTSPTPSHISSTPFASSHSPSPIPQEDCETEALEAAHVSSTDEDPANTFTVIFITSDKDSGRGSDTMCTPPLESAQQPFQCKPASTSNSD